MFDVDDLREAVIADRRADKDALTNVVVMRIVLILVRVPNLDDPAMQARILALGPLIRELDSTAVRTLIRYVTSVLPSGAPVRDRILELISEEQRTMVLSIDDEVRAEGHTKGTIERQRKNLLKVLAHRGLALDEPLLARVLGCTDEAQLERWFDCALVAATLADIFTES